MTYRRLRTAPAAAILLLASAVVSGLVAPPFATAQDDNPQARLRDAMSEIRRELDSGRYARAQRQVRQALEDLVEDGPADADPQTVGRLLFFEALAAAGRDLPDTTAWSWSLARSIDPELDDENLGRWRRAGRRLNSLPRRPLGDDGEVFEDPADDAAAEGGGSDGAGGGGPAVNLFAPPAGVSVELPRQQKRREPEFPPGLRGRGVRGPVILQVVIDRRGRPRDPLVRESPHPLLSYAAAEAVREWRFDPATVDGERVEVIYEMRFDIEPE